MQSPEAVADARDGDRFAFDPVTRRLVNETQSKTYEPVLLTAKEDEIRRGGGIFAIGRREFRDAVARRPEITWPDPATARSLTTTEQIVWAHRVDKERRSSRGATLRVYADRCRLGRHRAGSIHTFNQITGGATIFPRQLAIANDHFVFTGLDAESGRRRSAASSRSATASASPGTRIPATASSTTPISPSRASCCRASSFRRRFPLARLRRLRRGRHRGGVHDAGTSAGRRATSSSPLPGSAASCSPANCGRG